MLMPFGKYKGQDLETLTDDYLLWMAANIPLRDPLLSAVTEEITERGWDLPPPPPPQQPPRKPRETEEDKEKSRPEMDVIMGSSTNKEDA